MNASEFEQAVLDQFGIKVADSDSHPWTDDEQRAAVACLWAKPNDDGDPLYVIEFVANKNDGWKIKALFRSEHTGTYFDFEPAKD